MYDVKDQSYEHQVIRRYLSQYFSFIKDHKLFNDPSLVFKMLDHDNELDIVVDLILARITSRFMTHNDYDGLEDYLEYNREDIRKVIKKMILRLIRQKAKEF